MLALLQSISTPLCNYKHVSSPELVIYESLKLQYRGADKQRPSVLDLTLSLCAAVEHKAAAKPRASKRELFEAVCSEYNAAMSVRTWKVTGDVKMAIKNLCRTTTVFQQTLAGHFNFYKHEQSAVTVTVLASDFYIPGHCRLPSASDSPLWKSILTVTEEVSDLWLERMVSNFQAKAHKTASSKTKA